MLNPGDKVKFLNDVGGGTITGFQSKNIALVEGDDGFEIPVMITELVKIEDVSQKNEAVRDFSVKQQGIAPVEPEPNHVPELIEGNDSPDFHLAFYPTDQQNPVGGEIDVYLINDSNYSLLYQYSHFDGVSYQTIDSGEMEPNTKGYLEGLSQYSLKDLPKFFIRVIPFMKTEKELIGPFIKEIGINPVKFYKEKSFSENDFFDGNAMIFDIVADVLSEEVDKLTDKDFKKIVNTKDKLSRPIESEKKRKKRKDIVEVDLHIDELIDTTKGLSNREILEIQMDKFHTELKDSVKNHVKRIVFIHGVGNGVLKQEIQKELKSKYAKYYAQDASFKEYGYGATMVILKR